jgi:holin-like protein
MTLRFYQKIRFESMIDYLRGFAIVVGFQSLGLLLHRGGIPIPGGVLGLIVFYLAMSIGLVKLKWVERTASLLLHNMVLMFVPLTVGLMNMGPLLSRQALAISASLVVSLLAVLLTTGLLGRWLLPTEPILPELMLHTSKKKATEDGQ